jgi:signal transduction histidine kinase
MVAIVVGISGVVERVRGFGAAGTLHFLYLSLLIVVLLAGRMQAVRAVSESEELLRCAVGETARVRSLLEGEQRMTQALRASEGNARALLQTSADGILLMNARGVVRYLNPAAASLFAEKAGEPLDLPRAFRRAAEQHEEITIARAETTTIAEMRAIRTTWDGEDAYLATVRDITARKQAEIALRKANDKLRQMDQARSDFISMVSHELRTPLTSIKSAVHIMLSGKAGEHSETHERFLQMALRNIDRLAGILNELLGLAKLESGKMEFRFAEVEVGPIVDHVVATFSPQADATSLRLQADVPVGLPAVHADPGRIEQVLCNLVSNALKFTPAGGRVTIGARRDGNLVVVEVVDTGIGIALQDQEKIFEPFYQAGDLMTRSSKGTGLGMTIAREIVEAHGGRIWLESAPGRGTRFHFSIPVSSATSAEMTSFEESFRHNRDRECISVLVVVVRSPDSGLSGDESAGADLEILERVKGLIQKRLRKATDRVVVQPGCNRVLVVLPETPKAGATEVKKSLLRLFGEGDETDPEWRALSVEISGPATYPEDGMTGRELIESTLDTEQRRGRRYGGRENIGGG